MDTAIFTSKAKQAVADYFNNNVDVTEKFKINPKQDVFIVWYCKTLQNSKAMLSTNVSDGMYYEFTWNGDKEEGYLDAYKKFKNVVVK